MSKNETKKTKKTQTWAKVMRRAELFRLQWSSSVSGLILASGKKALAKAFGFSVQPRKTLAYGLAFCSPLLLPLRTDLQSGRRNREKLRKRLENQRWLVEQVVLLFFPLACRTDRNQRIVGSELTSYSVALSWPNFALATDRSSERTSEERTNPDASSLQLECWT